MAYHHQIASPLWQWHLSLAHLPELCQTIWSKWTRSPNLAWFFSGQEEQDWGSQGQPELHPSSDTRQNKNHKAWSWFCSGPYGDWWWCRTWRRALEASSLGCTSLNCRRRAWLNSPAFSCSLALISHYACRSTLSCPWCLYSGIRKLLTYYFWNLI